MPHGKGGGLAGRVVLQVALAVGLHLVGQRGQLARPYVEHHHPLRLAAPFTLVEHRVDADRARIGAAIARPAWWRGGSRSEEHTSELQSLMRISYAVFCSNKKTTNTQSQLIRLLTPDTHTHN